MKIQDLKEPYKSIATFDCKNQRKEKNINKNIVDGDVIFWAVTKAGHRFYSDLDRKNYPEITPQIKLDYPEVFTTEFINKEKALEMEEEFKVGDKIKMEYWGKQEFVTIDFIGKTRYFGTDEKGKEHSFRKNEDFKPYIKPIEKIKLQKFYCYDRINEGKIDAEGVLIRYFFSKEIGECQFDIVLTEEEFLEKFEI